MAPPNPADDAPAPEGVGLLERLGDQLAALATRVAEIDTRVTSVETGAPGPGQPVEVQLSPETVAQIVEAIAALQAAGSQALDEAFKLATDDLTEALSQLVTAEISRTLADAGYDVAVTEAPEPLDAEETVDEEVPETLPEALPVAASVRSAPEPASMPTIVAPMTASSGSRVDAAYDSIRGASPEYDSSIGHGSNVETDEFADDADQIVPDGPPLTLEDLDDPFLDALIRKEPLTASQDAG